MKRLGLVFGWPWLHIETASLHRPGMSPEGPRLAGDLSGFVCLLGVTGPFWDQDHPLCPPGAADAS